MRRTTLQKQSGFSTVELMVSLFVAALFILSGSQLYSVVTNRVAESREMSEASSIGYEVLRKEGSVYPVGVPTCPGGTTSTIARTSATLNSLSVSLHQCLVSSEVSLVRSTVTVSYSNPAKKVVHATYIAPN
jgi:hypothetical protein